MLLNLLHERISACIEETLQAKHGLSVREYSLMGVLSRQNTEKRDFLVICISISCSKDTPAASADCCDVTHSRHNAE